MITVKILADSINSSGVRLTSWLLTYPRFIHAEFMTHRIFSRNAASSRAIPFDKMLREVDSNTAYPERWGSEQKGMQSGDEVPYIEGFAGVKETWKQASISSAIHARTLHRHGLHKSLCNRLIEPFSHITVLATGTDHRNFFALRAHPEAMPEFQVLAYRMLAEYLKSEPRNRREGEWHIPNFGKRPEGNWSDEDLIKIATARCARLSYLTFDGQHDPAKDIELHDRLLASGHMSPFEHCAQAHSLPEINMSIVKSERYKFSNFDHQGEWSGWLQYRKQFEQENRTEVDYEAIMASKPEWITV